MATTRSRLPRAAVDLTFEELYRGHRDDVYRAALRELGNAHDAEDVTQAAFVDAYKAVLRGTQPQSPRAWLLAISENVRRRRFRTAQRRPREEALDDADFPLAADLSYEQAQALAAALAALPSEQRRVFVLREMVGLSYDEIAEEVDSTVASIQMLLFRARRSLRDELEPPTVAIQRAGGFLPPLPAWLAGFVSRAEITALTPRAAGALGAAALAVAGVSVAVPTSQAEGHERPAVVAKQTVTRTAKLVAAQPAEGQPARVAKKTTARSRRVVRSTPTEQPAPRSQPIPTLPRTFEPGTAPASGPVAAPTGEHPQAAPAPALPSGPVVSGTVTTPVELPAPPLSVPVPVPSPLPAPPPVPPLSVPVPLPAAPLPGPPPVVVLPVLPPPVDDATGAAGAAGASAPPLPVPSLPLPTLPPAP